VEDARRLTGEVSQTLDLVAAVRELRLRIELGPARHVTRVVEDHGHAARP